MNPGEKPERDERSPFANLPRYGGGAEVVHLYVCQECNVPSRYTRVYSVPTFIFLFFFIASRTETVMKCPGCMRLHLLIRLPLAVLLANLASSVMILWWLVLFVRTFFSSPD
jgi:hypothetical protein